ncbi:hypothetical protein EDC94DRAFT_606351 [Helicostylum pulchrum]|nr:hypothetical protein EDC94DRAFT_606351 [Helicostylum pulchrum]
MLSKKTPNEMPVTWLPLPTTQSSLSDVARQIYDGSSFDQEWKDLRHEPWRFYYLDYHHFKTVILYGKISDELEAGWEKVYEFYILKRGEIERRIESIRTTRNEQELKTVVIDIHQLYHFAKLNYCGFIQLFMQYERQFGSNIASDSLRSSVAKKPFYDHSIHLFALANSLNRLCIDKEPVPDKINLSPKKKQVDSLSTSSSSSCITSTINSCETASSGAFHVPKHKKSVKKYWVHPDNIVEVMLFMSTNNELVLQDKANNPSSTYSAVDEVGHPQGIKSESTQSIHHIKPKITTTKTTSNSSRLKVTTRYMDTLYLDDYTDRVIGKPTRTTRVREFEALNNNNDTYVSLEQKVYFTGQQNHNTCKGYKGLGKKPQQENNDQLLLEEQEQPHNWVQQRVWFKSKHLNQWLNGDYLISNILIKRSCQYRTDGLPTTTTRDKDRMENTCLQMQNELCNQTKKPSKSRFLFIY